MPSSNKSREAILNLIDEETSNIIYELGSGWGNLAFALAKKCKNTQVIAYELSPVPYAFSKALHFIFRYKNLTLLRKDFFRKRLENNSTIVCYLYPKAMEKIRTILPTQHRLISNTFTLPQVLPSQEFHIEDLYSSTIFLYNQS